MGLSTIDSPNGAKVIAPLGPGALPKPPLVPKGPIGVGVGIGIIELIDKAFPDLGDNIPKIPPNVPGGSTPDSPSGTAPDLAQTKPNKTYWIFGTLKMVISYKVDGTTYQTPTLSFPCDRNLPGPLSAAVIYKDTYIPNVAQYWGGYVMMKANGTDQMLVHGGFIPGSLRGGSDYKVENISFTYGIWEHGSDYVKPPVIQFPPPIYAPPDPQTPTFGSPSDDYQISPLTPVFPTQDPFKDPTKDPTQDPFPIFDPDPFPGSDPIPDIFPPAPVFPPIVSPVPPLLVKPPSVDKTPNPITGTDLLLDIPIPPEDDDTKLVPFAPIPVPCFPVGTCLPPCGTPIYPSSDDTEEPPCDNSEILEKLDSLEEAIENVIRNQFEERVVSLTNQAFIIHNATMLSKKVDDTVQLTTVIPNANGADFLFWTNGTSYQCDYGADIQGVLSSIEGLQSVISSNPLEFNSWYSKSTITASTANTLGHLQLTLESHRQYLRYLSNRIADIGNGLKTSKVVLEESYSYMGANLRGFTEEQRALDVQDIWYGNFYKGGNFQIGEEIDYPTPPDPPPENENLNVLLAKVTQDIETTVAQWGSLIDEIVNLHENLAEEIEIVEEQWETIEEDLETNVDYPTQLMPEIYTE
ncbi:MAG: hypothetical protein DSM107014_11405 [Gomphosphaeria aponina SAG 52.96 = DSM 107014]|uniref:Uncharacterized protein n=1 Tax=Gomphosphaeria aponina SAG 52.96 = DSM 107014 TaxID=1521640 RepID=A0A941GX15_9CHRO|nr:hypothetical protein [Gomphosphaeria aponina SAG 52.96 = DSM 107014]